MKVKGFERQIDMTKVERIKVIIPEKGMYNDDFWKITSSFKQAASVF